MASFSYTYTIQNGQANDATRVNQDFTDLRNFLLNTTIHGDGTNSWPNSAWAKLTGSGTIVAGSYNAWAPFTVGGSAGFTVSGGNALVTPAAGVYVAFCQFFFTISGNTTARPACVTSISMNGATLDQADDLFEAGANGPSKALAAFTSLPVSATIQFGLNAFDTHLTAFNFAAWAFRVA